MNIAHRTAGSVDGREKHGRQKHFVFSPDAFPRLAALRRTFIRVVHKTKLRHYADFALRLERGGLGFKRGGHQLGESKSSGCSGRLSCLCPWRKLQATRAAAQDVAVCGIASTACRAWRLPLGPCATLVCRASTRGLCGGVRHFGGVSRF